jgi:hypothetical protein
MKKIMFRILVKLWCKTLLWGDSICYITHKEDHYKRLEELIKEKDLAKGTNYHEEFLKITNKYLGVYNNG